MGNEIYIDTNGLASVASRIRADLSRMNTTLDNYNNELNEMPQLWSGPDGEKYLEDYYKEIKKIQLLKLIIEEYVEAVENLCNKVSGYSDF